MHLRPFGKNTQDDTAVVILSVVCEESENGGIGNGLDLLLQRKIIFPILTYIEYQYDRRFKIKQRNLASRHGYS